MSELSFATGILAAGFYLLACVLQARRLRTGGDGRPLVLLCGFAAVLLHAVSAWGIVRQGDGYLFGVTQTTTLISLAISVLAIEFSLRKRLETLFLGLFPLAVAAIALSLADDSRLPAASISPGTASHVLLAVLAYGCLTIAALQAVVLRWQNAQLKRGQFGGLIGRLPPLQDMEAFLLELLWAGQALLSLAIIAGVFFIDDVWSIDGIIHKSFFTVLSWLLFAFLLTGHYRLRWRGTTMVRGTLTGYVLLVIGYYGSRLVLEYVLG